MKKNKHIGSSFDDFLREEKILKEVQETALKRVIAYLLQKIKKRKTLKGE